MNQLPGKAFRLLAEYWLEELKPTDIAILEQIPQLGETISQEDLDLSDLAAEYQRLFGFNLPPYESLYVDPSVMLNTPATALVQQFYQQMGWQPPAGIRIGAPDHLGVELLALADLSQDSELSYVDRVTSDSADEAVRRLAGQFQMKHLALWVPVFLKTLSRLDPHPFYQRLGELTLELLLTTLPASSLILSDDPFPVLPPAPIYRSNLDEPPAENGSLPVEEPFEAGREAKRGGLARLINRLLCPRQAGLFLTRHDIARISKNLELPMMTGERFLMLKTLFELAGQYDLMIELLTELRNICQIVDKDYQSLQDTYPVWNVYAKAWQERVRSTVDVLAEIKLQVL